MAINSSDRRERSFLELCEKLLYLLNSLNLLKFSLFIRTFCDKACYQQAIFSFHIRALSAIQFNGFHIIRHFYSSSKSDGSLLCVTVLTCSKSLLLRVV